MRRFLFFAFLLFGFSECLLAEDSLSINSEWKFLYQGELLSDFDNTEFGGSDYQEDQTMAGTRLTAVVGLGNGGHGVRIGAYAIERWGEDGEVFKAEPMAWYSYGNQSGLRFQMGLFDRNVVRSYPRVLFQDSILFYCPVLSGFLLDYSHERSYGQLWLDWVGRKDVGRREAFFFGWTGRFHFVDWLYFLHHGYYYHYAKSTDEPDAPIHDNILTRSVFGIHLLGDEKSGSIMYSTHTNLFVEMGTVFGLERNRAISKWRPHTAFVAKIRAGWKCLWIDNELYLGDGQMDYYCNHGASLYWGDPIYRAEMYDRFDFGVNFIQSKHFNVSMVLTFHFVESESVYPEQRLVAGFHF